MDRATFLETLDKTEPNDRLKLALAYLDTCEKKRKEEWNATEKKRQEEWDATEKDKQRKWEERQSIANHTLYTNLMNLKREMDSKTHNRKLQRSVVRHNKID